MGNTRTDGDGERVTHKLVPDHANESRFEDAVDRKQLPIIDVIVKVKSHLTTFVAPRHMSLVP